MPARTAPTQDDHDSPWKDALDLFFPQALALLVPALHAEIDWSVAPDFLDKELQAIAPPGKQGRRFVDKLARVRLRDGADAWLLIHAEVERRLRGRQALRLFAWRMHEYRYRIQARVMRQRGLALPPPVYSLGILLDSSGVGDHLVHTDEHRGQGVRFTFPVVELEDWRERWGELVRSLKRYGYAPETAGQVYRLIEWMIALPKDLEPDYQRAITALSEESRMTYVTLIEREGIKRGRIEGRAEGQADLLLRQLQRRFGRVDAETTQRIRAARSQDLEAWSLNFVDATTPEDVFRG